MSKSSFSALVEAKKQRDAIETEEKNIPVKTDEKPKQEKSVARKIEKNEVEESAVENINAAEPISRPNKRDTVRRSYRVEETHDKAIKVMSKFMGQGTEEEIVLNIFRYFFENNADGKKALQMVEMLGSR
jgi:hypothetical protein